MTSKWAYHLLKRETRMKEIDFNLLDERWIIVTNSYGNEEILSLTDVLIRAHELRCLSGEMEAQDVAILRLLLGILYAIYTRTEDYIEAQEDGDGERCIEIWKNLWERGKFPGDEVTGYFKQYHDRFWLIHPERPFYQVASLKSQKTSEYKISKMLGDLVQSGNKKPLFSARTNKSKEKLPYPEASRWLIHLNGFDDAAFKTDNKDAGGISTGWLGQLGVIYIKGNNLFETLLLNFPLRKYNEEPWDSSNATWELEEPRKGERTIIPVPNSGEELFTLQSRRILLVHENNMVIGSEVIGGDHFLSRDAFNEPMTLWKVKKDRQKDFHLPMKEQNTSKQFWRDFTALLVENEDAQRPGILKWLDSLIFRNVIVPHNIKICTLNVMYGSQSSGIKEVWGDSVSVNAGLISTLNIAWSHTIIKLLKLTDTIAKCVGTLAADLELCKGLDEGEKKKNYKKIAGEMKEYPYLQLDNPFRTWLAAINPANKEHDYMNKTMEQWIETAKRIVLKIGKELVDQAGPQAFIGNKDMNAIKAYRKFRYTIRKILKEGGFV